MKHEILLPAVLISAALSFGGCKDSTQPNGELSSVSFYDKGAVVPHPVETMIIVQPEMISGVSYQDGLEIGAWSSPLDSQDFLRLVRITNDNSLFHGPAPHFGPGMCVGARDMAVIGTIDGLADTITIPGSTRCDTTTWPAGLRSLVSLRDSLVGKYHQ